MINLKRIQWVSSLRWVLIGSGLLSLFCGYLFNSYRLANAAPICWLFALFLEIYLSSHVPAAIWEKIGLKLTHHLIANSVMIREVLGGTRADKAGLVKGALIFEIDHQKIYSTDDAYALAIQVWQKLEAHQDVSIVTGQVNWHSEKTFKKE